MTRKVSPNKVKNGPKKVIILTGPSGAGKSLVRGWLARRGWRGLDADAIAKSLYRPGREAWRAIRRQFGRGVFGPRGAIDRKKLGAIVFSDPASMRKLDRIMAPLLIRELRRRLRLMGKACLDMAIYFKAGAPDFGGKVLLVDAPLKLRAGRILRRNPGKGKASALRQAKALRFGVRERRRSDLVLRNVGTAGALKKRLLVWLDKDV